MAGPSIFITGSADGLGRHTARTLVENGHDVVVHVRSAARLGGVQDLVDRGAAVVTGDLADLAQSRGVTEQVNRIGPMDAVIHNAGVLHGPDIFQVNVVDPGWVPTRMGGPAPRTISGWAT